MRRKDLGPVRKVADNLSSAGLEVQNCQVGAGSLVNGIDDLPAIGRKMGIAGSFAVSDSSDFSGMDCQQKQIAELGTVFDNMLLGKNNGFAVRGPGKEAVHVRTSHFFRFA